MAQFTNTELNATVDEKWDMDIEDGRYAAGVILNRVNSKSGVVNKSGDIINVTVKAKYTVGTVASDGAFVPQSYTPTSVPITVDQWEQIAIEVTDRAKAQSLYDPKSDFGKDVGRAYGERYDTQLAAQYSSALAANQLGDDNAPTPFDMTAARAGMLRLDDLDVPADDRSFALPPVAWYSGLYQSTELTSAHSSGQAKNVLTTGYKFNILGVPVYTTTRIATVGTSRKGLLFHRSALAIAFQYNNDVKRTDMTAALKFSSLVASQSLYGLKVIRSDHMVSYAILSS